MLGRSSSRYNHILYSYIKSYVLFLSYCSIVGLCGKQKSFPSVGFLAFVTFTLSHTILVSQDLIDLAHKLNIDQQIVFLL